MFKHVMIRENDKYYESTSYNSDPTLSLGVLQLT